MKFACARRLRQLDRRGLTLMELVVVLVILIAVAGVVLPMLPSFLTKTHDAVTTTNISEVDKAVGGYFAANLAYPDYFDSLVDTAGNMYAGLLFNSKNPVSQATFTVVGNVPSNSTTGAPLFVQALSSGQTQSLYYGGIKNLMIMQASSVSPPTAFNATFPNPPGAASGASLYLGLPGTTGVSAAIPAPNATSGSGSTVNAMFADNNYVFQKLNIQPTTDSGGNPCNYVVFGLGPYCTLVGAKSFGIIDAPVAFGEHNYEQPIVSYARYLCVFRVYSDGTRCEFVGSCHDDATGFGTFDMHVQEYYQTTN